MLPDVGDHPLAEELPSGAVLTEFPGAPLLQAGVEQGGRPMRDLSPSSGESLEVSRGWLRPACVGGAEQRIGSVKARRYFARNRGLRYGEGAARAVRSGR